MLQNETVTFVETGKGFLSTILFIGKKEKEAEILAFHLRSGKIFKRIAPVETPLSTPLLNYDKKNNKWIFKGWTEGRACTGWKQGLKGTPLILKQNHKD